MYRKKLPFKEDKNESIKSKGDNVVNLHVIQPFEESKTKRGRQLNIKTENIADQEVIASPPPTGLQINSQSIKLKSNNKNIPKCKGRNNTNKIISKAYQADDFANEEENESSDSDSLYENKKRKELCQDDSNFKDNPKYSQVVEIYSSNENDAGENYEFSDDMNFNYEDLLNNEIEKILIEIYNSNITRNSENSKKMDLLKYENNISLYSKKLNKQYNIFILQILSDKIKELVRRYKEKIFDIPEIKKIRDKFYEFKKNLLGISNPNETSQCCQYSLTKDKNKSVSTDYSDNASPKLWIHNETNSNNSNGSNNLDGVNKNPKGVEFHEPESVCKILLSELYNIKKCLIKSSKEIEKIFRLPFSHLKMNNKPICFNIEEMHKEEYFHTLIGDEFISALIAQVKTIFKHIKIEEINLLIAKIEEGIWTPNKEMTRFTEYLIDQLKSFIESDFLDEEDENLNLNNSNMSEVGEQFVDTGHKQISKAQICLEKIDENIAKSEKSEKNEKIDKSTIFYTSTNKKISFSMSSQIINEKPSKIGNDVGLDELLEYIAADENPKKANKKKTKKKKNSKNPGNNANSSANNNQQSAKKSNNSNENNLKTANSNSGTCPNTKEADQEVEMFKNSLKSQNGCAKKIKPNLSQEWLNNILNIVKASQ